MKPGTNVAASDATRRSHAHANESPAPAAGAVHGGDHGLRERADEPDVRVVGLLERLVDRRRDLAELLQVLPRAEPLAGARDDDAADRRVPRLGQRLPQRGVELAVERVVDLGAVERDREDGAVPARVSTSSAMARA